MDYTETLQKIEELSKLIEHSPQDTTLLMERGRLYKKTDNIRKALNDFIAVLEIEPGNKEAETYVHMLNAIFEFGYTEIYNL